MSTDIICDRCLQFWNLGCLYAFESVLHPGHDALIRECYCGNTLYCYVPELDVDVDEIEVSEDFKLWTRINSYYPKSRVEEI